MACSRLPLPNGVTCAECSGETIIYRCHFVCINKRLLTICAARPKGQLYIGNIVFDVWFGLEPSRDTVTPHDFSPFFMGPFDLVLSDKESDTAFLNMAPAAVSICTDDFVFSL